MKYYKILRVLFIIIILGTIYIETSNIYLSYKKIKLLNKLESEINMLETNICEKEHDFEDKIYVADNKKFYFTKCKKCDCIKRYNIID